MHVAPASPSQVVTHAETLHACISQRGERHSPLGECKLVVPAKTDLCRLSHKEESKRDLAALWERGLPQGRGT